MKEIKVKGKERCAKAGSKNAINEWCNEEIMQAIKSKKKKGP